MLPFRGPAVGTITITFWLAIVIYCKYYNEAINQKILLY